jgi:predicted dienelactone hydrolase
VISGSAGSAAVADAGDSRSGNAFGSRTITVHDAAQGIDFPAWVLFPAGPAAAGAKRWPVVAPSHGGGGANTLYRAVCTHLAEQGFVVVAPEHPGSHRRDNRLQGTLQDLADRPRHLALAVDAVLADAELGPRADAARLAVIGHSLGGTTALALAGGVPYMLDGTPVPVQADPRVMSLVLLAPAAGWFGAPGALRAVAVPILLLQAEHDDITPGWQGELVRRGVADPARVTARTVAGAGHFSFLSPFPPERRVPGFAPALDPAGFDREAFHRELPLEVSGFLRLHLMPGGAAA